MKFTDCAGSSLSSMSRGSLDQYQPKAFPSCNFVHSLRILVDTLLIVTLKADHFSTVINLC
jgi:hypothetical protein